MSCSCFGLMKTPVESIHLDPPAPIRMLSISVLFDAIRASDVFQVEQICTHFAIPLPAIEFAVSLKKVNSIKDHGFILQRLAETYANQEGRDLRAMVTHVRSIAQYNKGGQ